MSVTSHATNETRRRLPPRGASRTIARDVIRNVAVPRWLETGGKGRIERLNRVLVISQTPEVHAEIAERYKKILQPVVLSTGTGGPQPIVRGLRQRTDLIHHRHGLAGVA